MRICGYIGCSDQNHVIGHASTCDIGNLKASFYFDNKTVLFDIWTQLNSLLFMKNMGLWTINIISTPTKTFI